MVNVYRDENEKQLKRKQIECFLIYILAALMVLSFCGWMCVLLQKTRQTRFIWIAASVFCLGGWVLFLDYFRRLRPVTVKLRHLRKLMAGERKTFCGTVERVDGPITKEKDICAYRIQLCCDNGMQYVYWNEAQGPVPYKEKDTVRLDTSGRYVVAYEVNCFE